MTDHNLHTPSTGDLDSQNDVSKDQIEEAVRTLLRWIGEDPTREGLVNTPRRVADAYREYCRGYRVEPDHLLSRTFSETENYDEMVLLRDIRFESMCEHHLAPIIGKAHIAYLPSDRVVGISKIARVVDAYAKRLQIQERLTAQIADCIARALKPRGIAVAIDAVHHCMTTRGIHRPGVSMVTSEMRGLFRESEATRQEFFALVRQPSTL